MCCSITVQTTVSREAVLALLRLSGFSELSSGVMERLFAGTALDSSGDQRQRAVRAWMYEGNHSVQFNIVPSIGEHTEADHRRAALQASVIFQLAQVLVDDGGHIQQNSLVGLCRDEQVAAGIVPATIRALADSSWPRGQVLEQSALCLGFRTVLYNGIALIVGEEAELVG